MSISLQDLVRSLTITNSTKPLRSRFTGQGFVNCLNTTNEPGDWKYSTNSLKSLCGVAATQLDSILRNVEPKCDGLVDNKLRVSPTAISSNFYLTSTILQALYNILEPMYKEKKKVVIMTSGLTGQHTMLAKLCNNRGIR